MKQPLKKLHTQIAEFIEAQTVKRGTTTTNKDGTITTTYAPGEYVYVSPEEQFAIDVKRAKKFLELNTKTHRSGPAYEALAKDSFELAMHAMKGDYPGVPSFETSTFSTHIVSAIVNADGRKTEPLLRLAEAVKAPWYVRREALLCLRETKKEIEWSRVVSLLKIGSLEIEVKRAALDLIVHHQRTELIPDLKPQANRSFWFFKPSGPQEDPDDYFVQELARHMIIARAKLGDTDTLVPVLEFRNDAWSQKRDEADRAWASLEARYGGSNELAKQLLEQSDVPKTKGDVWQQLKQHPHQDVLRWAISQAPLSAANTNECIVYLAHRNWDVRKTASDWLIKHKAPIEGLLAVLNDADANLVAASWAAFVVMEISDHPQETLAESLSNPAKEELFAAPWPFETPQVIRDAVINEYAGDSEPGSDVRYALEYKLHLEKRPPYETEEQDREALINALRNKGIGIGFVQEAGEHMQQGGGTYWVVQLKFGDATEILKICSIGKIIQLEAFFQSEETMTYIQPTAADMSLVKTTAEALGFLCPSAELLSQTVPGLNVYYFGAREPLTLNELLFYWQD